ncbi:MAG TPA: hypothetical protein VJI13_05230 [Candidatus Norongarragalinales archaeon]|nr:hypothetical protein [Candidatus Norongarragalinales archaeon]
MHTWVPRIKRKVGFTIGQLKRALEGKRRALPRNEKPKRKK